jgi:hypothetical protein
MDILRLCHWIWIIVPILIICFLVTVIRIAKKRKGQMRNATVLVCRKWPHLFKRSAAWPRRWLRYDTIRASSIVSVHRMQRHTTRPCLFLLADRSRMNPNWLPSMFVIRNKQKQKIVPENQRALVQIEFQIKGEPG